MVLVERHQTCLSRMAWISVEWQYCWTVSWRHLSAHGSPLPLTGHDIHMASWLLFKRCAVTIHDHRSCQDLHGSKSDPKVLLQLLQFNLDMNPQTLHPLAMLHQCHRCYRCVSWFEEDTHHVMNLEPSHDSTLWHVCVAIWLCVGLLAAGAVTVWSQSVT